MVIATAAAIGIGGCGGPTPVAVTPGPSSTPGISPLPPRPTTLRMDGIDPCKLLTATQLTKLDIREIGPTSNAIATVCVWGSRPGRPDDSWAAGFYREGADRGLLGEGAEVSKIGGFGAVKTASALGDRNFGCILDIDTAPGEQLRVDYENTHKDAPGMSHEVACQRAATAAEMMVANLRTLAR